MWKRWITYGCGAMIALGLIYWQIIIGEGTYLGRRVVRAIYRWGAPVYDQVRAAVTRYDHVHVLSPLRFVLLEHPDAAVLDVATGTGRVPLLLAQEPWFKGSLYGLDLTPEMLALAQQKAQALGVAERIHWVLGSGDQLARWPDQRFLVVSCLEALEYFPRPKRAVQEMWRVLQPGGMLMISTWTPQHARWLPGKAWTADRLVRFLMSLGAESCDVRAWQPGYELVLVTKYGSTDN